MKSEEERSKILAGGNAMEKNKIRAIAVIIFGAFLVIPALTGGGIEQPELRQLQDAMRDLKRVDNLEMSYINSVSRFGIASSEQVDVWADMLTGSWTSEHYTTDEDGTRPYLKKFFDGKSMYVYVDWQGRWAVSEEADSSEVPNLDKITTFEYGADDILEVTSEEEDGGQKITCTFTPEYLEKERDKQVAQIESMYVSYQKNDAADDMLRLVEMTVEQTRQMRYEDVSVTYMIDENQVLRGMEYSAKMIMPQMGSDEHGEPILGEESETQMLLKVNIKGYDRDDILRKIGESQAGIDQ